MLEDYSEEQFQAILENRIRKLTKNKEISEHSKVAYLLGGQPGAGKTSLQDLIKQKNKNAIIIDNDSYKRLHPNYTKLESSLGKEVTSAVTPFSNRMTEQIIDRLSNLGYDLIIEGTLRTIEVPINTTQMLKEKNYDVSLYVIATPFDQSYVSTIKRYEESFKNEPTTARFTPKETQLTTVEALPFNIDKLSETNIFQEIAIYNRKNELLYSSTENNNITPGTILKSQLKAKLEPREEIQELDKVLKLIKSNHHEDSEQYQDLQQRKKVINMNRRENYIEQLKEHIAEDDYLAYGKGTEEIIYKIDDINVYGGFYGGVRGYDHNELLLDNVTWKDIITWGTVAVPETKSYISDSIDPQFESIGYIRLPLDNNHIMGFKNPEGLETNLEGTEQSSKDVTVQESLDKYAEDHKIELKQDQEQERGI